MPSGCFFCDQAGGEIVWQDAFARIIVAADADHPGLCRVVLNRHVKEMTDLPAQEQSRLMRLVLALESAQRAVLEPVKINLASFGNQVPHLHWHVVPRFADDPHYPDAIFAVRRGGRPHPVPVDYRARLAAHLGADPGREP